MSLVIWDQVDLKVCRDNMGHRGPQGGRDRKDLKVRADLQDQRVSVVFQVLQAFRGCLEQKVKLDQWGDVET